MGRGRHMNICLVSNEILGAHRNGGIGAVTSHLALLLARHGHSVTLFYADRLPLEPQDRWTAAYRRANISVCHYPRSVERVNPPWMSQPVGIFEQLQYRDFDVVVFQDWMALGHACVVAKRAGIAFRKTTLAVIAHSSNGWILEANRAFPTTRADLAILHMEQQSVELADAVVSPSLHMIQWMREAGWKLPSDVSVLPFSLSGLELMGATGLQPAPTQTRGVEPAHLAFFGRLEERQGIGIFLDALVSPQLRGLRFKVSFLGRPATTSPEQIRAFLGAHRPDLLPSVDFHPALSSDEAQAFLVSAGCVAVIPSPLDNSPCVVYESLRLGLRFVAARSGGIPELIDSRDWDRCLFEPAPGPLAAKLREVLCAASWDPPRAAYDEGEIASRWLDWFADHAPKAAAAAPARPERQSPDTTVILTHFERPRLAEQALRVLAVQTDRCFDVVLVDDGSQSAEALEFLDRAARGIAGLNIDVVRQSNRYLGAARNAGLRRAHGSFVIFLDDDNIPFPNMTEVFRRAALETGADIVTCQMQFFHETTGEPKLSTLLTSERWAFSGGPVELGVIQNCFGDATAIYKRSVFERIGGFHEIHGVAYEDWQLHLRASLEGLTLLSLPLPLFWYRVTPNSISRSTSHGANMQVIAAAVQKKLPQNLARVVDLMIGTHPAKQP